MYGTVTFFVTMIICAAANTVQRGTNYKLTKPLNQMNPIQLNEISNRVRRNAAEVPNVSEMPEADENARRSLLQDILSHLPSKDIIKCLLSRRIKRSYFDYDSSEDQENINPKNQLEQISSRSFAPNAYNEDQRRKLFFSQLFSMIDGSTNFEKSKIDNENDNPLKSNNSFKTDIGEIFSEKSRNQRTDKHSNINLEKNVYVPLRKIKKRRQVQESNSFPHNLNKKKKVNERPERQLGKLINDDNADTQFYKLDNYTSRTSVDYDSIETSMEQQLPYGPTGDDAIETSSVFNLPITSDSSIDYDSNEEVDYITHLVSSSPSTLDSQSSVPYTIPSNINKTKENNLISTNSPLNPFKRSRGRTKKVTYLNINVTEPPLTTKDTFTSDVVESNKDFVKKENEPSRDSSSNYNSEFTTIISPVEKTDHPHQNLNTGAPVKIRNEFDKKQSRRTNANLEDKNMKPNQIENISKPDQEQAGQIQDIEVANAYGEADVTSNQSNVLVNPLSARIKLDFLIQLQALGNDGQ